MAIALKPFKAGLLLLTAAYQVPLNDAITDAYYAVLRDSDQDAFLAAINELLAADREFLPKPGAVLAAVRRHDPALDRDCRVRGALRAGFLPANLEYDGYAQECARLGISESPHAARFYTEQRQALSLRAGQEGEHTGATTRDHPAAP